MGVSNGCVLSSHSVLPDLRVVVYRVAIAAGGEREWDNVHGRYLAWNFFRNNWDTIFKK